MLSPMACPSRPKGNEGLSNGTEEERRSDRERVKEGQCERGEKIGGRDGVRRGESKQASKQASEKVGGKKGKKIILIIIACK